MHAFPKIFLKNAQIFTFSKFVVYLLLITIVPFLHKSFSHILPLPISAHDLPPEAFDWYVDLRRYGTVPHSGFGMGVERVVAWICGLEHVREAIPYPRMLHRLTP